MPSVFDVMRSSSFSGIAERLRRTSLMLAGIGGRLWRTSSNLADTVSADGRLARILDMMSPPSAGAGGGSCSAA